MYKYNENLTTKFIFYSQQDSLRYKTDYENEEDETSSKNPNLKNYQENTKKISSNN